MRSFNDGDRVFVQDTGETGTVVGMAGYDYIVKFDPEEDAGSVDSRRKKTKYEQMSAQEIERI